MRVCIQRVSQAKVIQVESGKISGQIGPGLLVLLGVKDSDTESDAVYLANKSASLRIFEDDAGKMNLSLLETGGKMLIVSQFTLYADCRKGRRPSFTEAAKPEKAIPLYRRFIEEVAKLGIEVAEGEFQTEMRIELANEGPVTIWIDSENYT